MSNLDEVLSAFDPAYFATKFKASLASQGDAVVITFTCVKDKTYSVQKASSVNGTYKEIGSVTAANTGSASLTDGEAGNGPNFYRVIEQP
jgi:hypothetical protein